MYAYCEFCGLFYEEDIIPFAEAHPEYQIEMLAECDEGCDKSRVLYQGDIMESFQEEHCFPEPKLIQWKYGE